MDNSPQFGTSTIRRGFGNLSNFSLLGKSIQIGTGEILIPKSPVLHLLKSNASPSEEERLVIEQVLSTAYDRAAVIDQKLEGISQDLSTARARGASRKTNVQLQSHLAQLQTFIHIHEQLLFRVRQLPNELLALIFILSMPSVAPHQWSRRPWNYCPTFRLSQVCRRWRVISHATPQLWTLIGDVNLDQSTAVLSTALLNRASYKYYDFLEDILHRSQGEPLWVFVHAPLQAHKRHEHPIIDLIVKHSSRWEVLTIASSRITVDSICAAQRAFYPNPSAPFPLLRRLGLELGGYTQSTVLDGFAVAPSLQELSVVGIQPHELLVPWDQLLIYREKPTSMTTLHGNLAAVLDKAKELERLEVSNFGYPAAPTSSAAKPKWNLSRLRSLSLKVAVKNYAEALLGGITAASLEEMRIAADPFYIVPQLISLVERSLSERSLSFLISGFPLKKLFLSCNGMRSEDLSKLLRLTPNLQELNINFPPLATLLGFIFGGRTRCATTKLVRRAHSPQLVPNLKKLTLRTDVKDVQENESTLRALGRARSSNCTGEVNEEDMFDVQVMEEFRLVFRSGETAIVAQSIMNLWIRNTHRNPALVPRMQGMGPDAVLLTTYRLKLHEELPELCGKHAPKKRKFGLTSAPRLHKLLSSIEEFDLGVDPRRRVASIYVSRLHLYLLRLSYLQESHIPGDKKYMFRARAQNLLRKWGPIIEDDLSSPQTTSVWALKGDRSLVYIPEDHRFRASSELRQMVYGLEDELHDVDLDWPSHM